MGYVRFIAFVAVVYVIVGGIIYGAQEWAEQQPVIENDSHPRHIKEVTR